MRQSVEPGRAFSATIARLLSTGEPDAVSTTGAGGGATVVAAAPAGPGAGSGATVVAAAPAVPGAGAGMVVAMATSRPRVDESGRSWLGVHAAATANALATSAAAMARRMFTRPSRSGRRRSG